MYAEITSTRQVADQLRPLIEQVTDATERRIAFEALYELEYIEWHPLPFMWARRSVPGNFRGDSHRITGYEAPLDRPDFSAAIAVARLVLVYTAELHYLRTLKAQHGRAGQVDVRISADPT
jgi:hypothetical protein